MTTVSLADERALRMRRAFFGPLTRLLNPLIRRMAERSASGMVGLVSHRGRRSGRIYSTPVAIGSAGGVFLIPLTFGSTSDWCRNVVASGGCSVTWRGQQYMTDQAEVVDDAAIGADLGAAFGLLTRFGLSSMGTHRFLRLRVQSRQPVMKAA